MIAHELDEQMKDACKHGLTTAKVELIHSLIHVEEYMDDWAKTEPHTYHGHSVATAPDGIMTRKSGANY